MNPPIAENLEAGPEVSAPKVDHPPYIKPRTEYALTITPECQCHRLDKKNVTEKHRDVAMTEHWNKWVSEASANSCEVILFMEASEPCRGNRAAGIDKSSPRLHWHGFITFTNTAACRWWFMYGAHLLASASSYDLDTINDRDRWHRYCRKQSFLRWPVLKTLKYDTPEMLSEVDYVDEVNPDRGLNPRPTDTDIACANIKLVERTTKTTYAKKVTKRKKP